MQERAKQGYTDDEIEAILRKATPKAELLLGEIRETVIESPILALGLTFTFGILVGLGLSQSRSRG